MAALLFAAIGLSTPFFLGYLAFTLAMGLLAMALAAVGIRGQPVRGDGHEQRLHVLRQGVLAPAQQRMRPRRPQQREPRTRRQAHADPGVVAAAREQPLHVVDQRLHLRRRRGLRGRRDLKPTGPTGGARP